MKKILFVLCALNAPEFYASQGQQLGFLSWNNVQRNALAFGKIASQYWGDLSTSQKAVAGLTLATGAGYLIYKKATSTNSQQTPNNYIYNSPIAGSEEKSEETAEEEEPAGGTEATDRDERFLRGYTYFFKPDAQKWYNSARTFMLNYQDKIFDLDHFIVGPTIRGTHLNEFDTQNFPQSSSVDIIDEPRMRRQSSNPGRISFRQVGNDYSFTADWSQQILVCDQNNKTRAILSWLALFYENQGCFKASLFLDPSLRKIDKNSIINESKKIIQEKIIFEGDYDYSDKDSYQICLTIYDYYALRLKGLSLPLGKPYAETFPLDIQGALEKFKALSQASGKVTIERSQSSQEFTNAENFFKEIQKKNFKGYLYEANEIENPEEAIAGTSQQTNKEALYSIKNNGSLVGLAYLNTPDIFAIKPYFWRFVITPKVTTSKGAQPYPDIYLLYRLNKKAIRDGFGSRMNYVKNKDYTYRYGTYNQEAHSILWALLRFWKTPD